MNLYRCNHCKIDRMGRYIGKNYAPPIGWWVGRTCKWPRWSPGEAHACSKDCRDEVRKEHRHLFWNHVTRGKVLVRNAKGQLRQEDVTLDNLDDIEEAQLDDRLTTKKQKDADEAAIVEAHAIARKYGIAEEDLVWGDENDEDGGPDEQAS